MAHTTGTTPSQACGCSYLLPHPHMRHDQAKKPALARAYREETLSQFLRRRGRRQAESRGSARQEEEGWRQRRAPQTSRGRRQAGAAAAVLHCQAGAAGLTGRRAVGRGTSADGGTRHPRHCTAVGSQSSLSASSPSSVAQLPSDESKDTKTKCIFGITGVAMFILCYSNSSSFHYIGFSL
ncbi:uncharacterized protein LOC120674514 isoform X5 [Panicum virgatum]|uniref:uncharacterized protein LOC120674514 isoform X5 n=1 Tax=Panicum virgatum TaxID=38727 RepID=UPI0019D55A43|nr:uncharacterized protein LOC120674514 isoform X5 [Panicum virgatum]